MRKRKVNEKTERILKFHPLSSPWAIPSDPGPPSPNSASNTTTDLTSRTIEGLEHQ